MQEAVLIDSFGMWSLEDLGYEDLSFQAAGQPDEPAVLYRLPEQAIQGNGTWYRFHLKIRVKFDEAKRGGTAYVSAATNGATAAQIKLQLVDGAKGGVGVMWRYDLVNGQVEGRTLGSVADITFSNYLQISGVQGGLNALTFSLEQNGEIAVESLVISRESGIELAPLSPPRLEILADLPEGRLAVGDDFTISFDVRNAGGVYAESITVGSRYSPVAFSPVGPTSHSFPTAAASSKGSLSFKALQTGYHELQIEAMGGGSQPVTTIGIEVYPDRGNKGTVGGPLAIAGIGAIIAVILAVTLSFRKRFA